MNVRTQNLMAILPVFAAIGIAYSALMLVVQHEELTWGASEEARAAVVGTAAFAEGAAIGSILAEREDEPFQSWRLALEQVFRRGIVKRAAVFDLKDGRMLRSFDAPSVRPLTERGVQTGAGWEKPANLSEIERRIRLADLSPELLREVSRGETVVSPVHRDELLGEVITSYSLIRDSEGNAAAVMMAESEAGWFSERVQAIRGKILYSFLGVISFGAAISLLISSAILAKIRTLTAAAIQIASGQRSGLESLGAIREVSDLGDTLRTMSSVLDNAAQKSRKKQVEIGQYRPVSAQLEMLHKRFGTLGAAQHQSFEFGSWLANPASDREVLIAVQGEESTRVLSVTLKAESTPGELAALYRFSRELLKSSSDREAFEKLSELFDVERCQLLTIPHDASAAGMSFFAQDGQEPVVSKLPLPDSETIIIDSLPPMESALVTRCAKAAPELSPPDFAPLLAVSLRQAARGAVIAVKRTSEGRP